MDKDNKLQVCQDAYCIPLCHRGIYMRYVFHHQILFRFLFRLIVVIEVVSPEGPFSFQEATRVSFFIKSEIFSYFNPLPMVIKSSEVKGSLPCLSQQL